MFPRRATIEDVAQAAGVSRQTVSRAINGKCAMGDSEPALFPTSILQPTGRGELVVDKVTEAVYNSCQVNPQDYWLQLASECADFNTLAPY